MSLAGVTLFYSLLSACTFFHLYYLHSHFLFYFVMLVFNMLWIDESDVSSISMIKVVTCSFWSLSLDLLFSSITAKSFLYLSKFFKALCWRARYGEKLLIWNVTLLAHSSDRSLVLYGFGYSLCLHQKLDWVFSLFSSSKFSYFFYIFTLIKRFLLYICTSFDHNVS